MSIQVRSTPRLFLSQQKAVEQKGLENHSERALRTRDQSAQRIQYGIGGLLFFTALCAILFFVFRDTDRVAFSTAVSVTSHKVDVYKNGESFVVEITCTFRNDGTNEELLSANGDKLDYFQAGYDETYWFTLYGRDASQGDWVSIEPGEKISYTEIFDVSVDEWSRINQPLWFTALVKQRRSGELDYVTVVHPKPTATTLGRRRDGG